MFFLSQKQMSSAGTLLSDLDSRGPSGQDSDLVEKILADMNSGGAGGGSGNQVQMPTRGMAAPPPPLPSQLPPGMVQANSTFAQVADPMTAQAHVIGRDHPSPADFAAAMHGVNRPPETQAWPGQGYDEPKKNWYAHIVEEAKTPLVVAMLFFVFSLPPVNVLISHYVPSLIQSSGNLTTVGSVAKALLVGTSYWVLLRIVAPLLKT
jgi:hypothetical protein